MAEKAKLLNNEAEEEETHDTRHWESVGFAISKIVIFEGDMSLALPRYGCSGEFEINTSSISVTGLEWNEVKSHIELSRYYNAQYFKESEDSTEDVTLGQFRIGNGDTDIDRSLEELLCSMYPGEKSEVSFRMCLDMRRRQHLLKILNIELNNKAIDNTSQHWITLQFTLRLVPEKLKYKEPIYCWNSMNKIEEAQAIYESAIKLFQARRYYDSFVFFRQALTLCHFVLTKPNTNSSKNNEIKPQNTTIQLEEKNSDMLKMAEILKEKCESNITACHFQWANNKHVIFLATERLKKPEKKPPKDMPDSNIKVKMLYRRGVSNALLNNFDEAISDFNNLLLLEPSNKAAQQKLKDVKSNRQKNDVKMSNAMKKLFQSTENGGKEIKQ